MPVPNDTTYGESLMWLIADFMNLVNACEYKGVQFESVDGFTLQDCRASITEYLTRLGYDKETIDGFWSGENEMISS